MKLIVQYILTFCAKFLLRKYKPVVIGVTGSVGKTTTKEFLAHVLKVKYSVLATKGNYNSEFGAPLSILELEAAKSRFGWFRVVGKACSKLWKSKDFYEIVILEMGADKPGDIAYLTHHYKPNIGIVTTVEYAHLQAFKTRDALAYEKGNLIRNLKEDSVGFANYDNESTRKMVDGYTSAKKVYSFGFDSKADIYANEIQLTDIGLKSKIHQGSLSQVVHTPYLISKSSLYAVLITWGVARYLEIPITDIVKRIKTLKEPEGRMNLAEGINHSIIIDSTYNAEPSSMLAALQTLKDFPKGERKIAILGDMLELGSAEKILHEKIGKTIHQYRLDIIIFVGPRMKYAYDEYNKNPVTYSRGVLYCENSEHAKDIILQKVTKGDIVLIKGSNSMKMNIILESLQKK